MTAGKTWFLPVAGGLLMLVVGIAALRAGDSLRSANLDKEAQRDAMQIVAGIQSSLLEMTGAASMGEWPTVANGSEDSSTGQQGESVR